jgi:hypothetical protein
LAVVIEDEARFGVRLRVSATDVVRFQPPWVIRVTDEAGNPIETADVVIGPDAQPGFIQVELLLRMPSPGRTGVRIVSESAFEGLIVPWTSVAADGARSWVAVAVPAQTETGETRFSVERRTVVLGRAHPDGVEAQSGIEPGDRVIRFEPRSHREGRWVVPREGAGPELGTSQ